MKLLYKVFVPSNKYLVEDTAVSNIVRKFQNKTMYGGLGPLSVIKDFICGYDIQVQVKTVEVGEIITPLAGRFVSVTKKGEVIIVDLDGNFFICTWDMELQKPILRKAAKIVPV